MEFGLHAMIASTSAASPAVMELSAAEPVELQPWLAEAETMLPARHVVLATAVLICATLAVLLLA